MGKGMNIALIAAGSFIAGILLAPKSGKETRKELMDKANQYKGKAEAGMDEVKKGAAAVKDELADSAETMMEIGKDAAGGVKRTANRVKKEASTRAKIVEGEVRQTAADARRAAR